MIAYELLTKFLNREAAIYYNNNYPNEIMQLDNNMKFKIIMNSLNLGINSRFIFKGIFYRHQKRYKVIPKAILEG